MSQTKDPAIKLFGRNITVPDIQIPAKRPSKFKFQNRCSDITEGKIVSLDQNSSPELDKSAVTTQGIEDNQTRIEANEGSNSSKPRDNQAEFKKPDKIVPCPRCNSLDTKFCYFNNYNVNQPRHFCKNCQRYWTAGGTMRNVPIGAGRRRNKHLASQYRQILVSSSDGVPIATMENPETPAESSNTPGNGMVLKFSSEPPLSESMEKTQSLGDQKSFQEMSSVSTQDNIGELNKPKTSNEVNGQHPHCYSMPPWLFPWNGNNGNQVQWCPTPIIAVPGFCPSSIPVQLVPASYLSCMPVFVSPSSSTSTSCCSGSGKHSRDSNVTDEEQAENGVKTPRIDEQKIPISNCSVFKTLETKSEGKSRITEASPILEANPAALCRANTFQESS